MAEHHMACLVQDAAILCILQADDCCRLAWNNFALLMSNLGAPPHRDKGSKGHVSSPVSVHNDSDLEVTGFANDPQTGDDSGEKDDEDEEYGDKDEDEAADGSSGVMDVS